MTLPVLRQRLRRGTRGDDIPWGLWRTGRLHGRPAAFHNEVCHNEHQEGTEIKALAQFVDTLPEPVIGLLDVINPPQLQTCRIRAFCLTELETEIARADNEVFSADKMLWMRRFTNDHAGDCNQAKKAMLKARNRPNWNHRRLQLQYHWLTLVGHRMRVERRWLLGGIVAARTRALEVLGGPPKEVMQWDVDLLFQLYCNTQLRSEWDYDGYKFRI